MSNMLINYTELINNRLTAFRNLGCSMSMHIHYTFSRMNRFPENLCSMGGKQGKRFHQDMWKMKTRFQGRRDAVMMVDYYWNLKRNLSVAEHSRIMWKRKFKHCSLNCGDATYNLRVSVNYQHLLYHPEIDVPIM